MATVMAAKRGVGEYKADEEPSLRERVNQERPRAKAPRRVGSFNNS